MHSRLHNNVIILEALCFGPHEATAFVSHQSADVQTMVWSLCDILISLVSFLEVRDETGDD